MKPKNLSLTSLHFRASSAALAAVFIAMSSSAHAQSWDAGGAPNLSWNLNTNWNPNTVPTWGTATLLTFDVAASTHSYLGNAIPTVKSITFGDAVDTLFEVTLRAGISLSATTVRDLTFSANTGNATLNVGSGALGNITVGVGTGAAAGGGLINLTSNLDVIHNGSGELLFNRPIQGAGAFTKTGTGTFRYVPTILTSYSGAVSINQGRAIFAAGSVGFDFAGASAVNLGGGILEVRTTTAIDKTIDANTTVSSASTLTFNNTAATDQRFTLQTGTMALNANLTLGNISSSVAGNNIINVSRNLTGSGNLIVETYNNVASGAVSFSNGRVQLSGDNTAWAGNLVVAKGTAQFSGTSSLVPTAQSITLGTTGNSFGAALGFNQETTDATLANAITVTTGGVRLIRNNGGSSTTNNIVLDGAIQLDGTLTVDHAGLGAGKSVTISGNATGAGGLEVTLVGPNQVADSSVRITDSNTYTGATTIGSGTLVVESTGTINSTSGVSIGAGEFRYSSSTALSQGVTFSTTGGTLSGTGTIIPTINITTGNTLAVGDGGIGTLSLGDALTVGGTYLYELNGGTSFADFGDVTGNLALGGILDLVQLGAYTAGDKFTLFAYDGSVSGVFNDSGLVNIADDTSFIDGGGIWTINYNDGTAGLNGGVSASNTYVTITAIPEPNAAALLGALGALALLRRRRA